MHLCCSFGWTLNWKWQLFRENNTHSNRNSYWVSLIEWAQHSMCLCFNFARMQLRFAILKSNLIGLFQQIRCFTALEQIITNRAVWVLFISFYSLHPIVHDMFDIECFLIFFFCRISIGQIGDVHLLVNEKKTTLFTFVAATN